MMSKYDEQLDYAGKQIITKFGKKPKKPIEIYTSMSHVSRSGMMRIISAFIMVENNPVCIARDVKMTGCGMDMGFELAYNIFHAAYKYGEPRYQDYLNHRWL